jgi:8-oxo-dGTP pyrophosphatase MutT (NUDIX family)
MTAQPVRDAATVVLLRDGGAGIEVWLLTRVRQMAFAAGMSVFPGGRVDEDDADLPWVGPAPAQLAARFGCDERLARSLVGAAVRETFEETGVLLTVPAASLAAARADVEAGRVPFGTLLREHGLAVDAEAVRPWARWITPAGEVRRYDTRFFVAALPPHAYAADLTSESSVATWVSVHEALAGQLRGERAMLPPTVATLRSVAEYPTVGEVLGAADSRSLDPIAPVLHRRPDGLHVELPDGTLVPLPRAER